MKFLLVVFFYTLSRSLRCYHIIFGSQVLHGTILVCLIRVSTTVLEGSEYLSVQQMVHALTKTEVKCRLDNYV